MSTAAKVEQLDALVRAACVVDLGAMELSTVLTVDARESSLSAQQVTLAFAFAVSASAAGLGMLASSRPLLPAQLSTVRHVVALLRAAADIFEAVEAGAQIDG